MSKIVPIVPTGGNTKTPVVKENKKQISCSKRWYFTLNNYTNEHIDIISSIVPEICDKYIVGKEISEENQTPHLQGFVTFMKKCRPKSKIPIDEIHWEKALGSDMSQNYCGKEGNVILKKGIPRPLVKMTRDKLWEKQLKIVDMFVKDEDPLFGRNIHWFWETQGKWGKSILCTYMIDFMGAMEVSGASADILCGVAKWIENNEECPPIIIFDIPRCNQGHVSYQAIEKIKDGKFFSGKYESGMVRFNKPHIICFANEIPETHKLSEDRWIITELE